MLLFSTPRLFFWGETAKKNLIFLNFWGQFWWKFQLHGLIWNSILIQILKIVQLHAYSIVHDYLVD